MILNETKMKVKKDFAHDINEQDPYSQIEFYLLVDGEYYQTDGTTSAEFDDDLVYKLPVNADNEWTNEVFIAPGVMKDGQVLETGHKYTLEEKIIVGNEYEYQFTPQTVRPMNINGTLTYLVLVDKYNPAPADADLYVIDNEEYYASTESEGALVGTNRKTAELDITKMIIDRTGEFTTAQLDDETFTYRVTLTVPADADISGITAYEYVARYDAQPSETRFTIFGYQSSEPAEVQGISTDVSRFTGKIYGAYTVTTSTSSRQMTDMFTEDAGGETLTATIDITLKRNEIIRFTNLPANTEYTIVEMYNDYRSADPSRDADAGGSTMASNIAERGYTTTVATKSRNPVSNSVRTDSVTGTTVTGVIDYLDVRYYNQFTNTLNDAIDVELTGVKHLEGYEWSGERYYFNLAKAEGGPDETPLPVIGSQGRVRFYLSNASGTDDKSYSFGKIRFKEAGTYTYTITEDNAGTVGVVNGTAVEYGAAETVTIVIEENDGKLSVKSVTGEHTTWNADTLTAETTITNVSPTVDVTAVKAWENADGTTDAPDGAKVTFTLYADGTATDSTVELDGTADNTGESEAWTASFTGLPKYKVTEGAAVEIVYTIGETQTWEGYELVTTDPVASGGTITNKQSTKWIKFVKTDTDGAALPGAEFTFDPGTGEVTLTSGSDGVMATSGTDAVSVFELGVSDEDYVLAEAQAPEGYLPLTSAVSISVTDDGVTAELSDGTEFEVSGTGTQTDPYVITITNAPGVALPNAGGSGTMGFYVLGMILMLGAAAVLLIRRRNVLAE